MSEATLLERPKETTKSESGYREPPYNVEAEQIVLGAILTDNEGYNRIADFLLAEHFYDGAHRKIYEAVERFSERGLIANPVTLKNTFEADPLFAEIGGANYLARIAGMASDIVNIRDHASIVYSLAISRELIHIGRDMLDKAYNSSGERRASEQIEESEQKLFNLASQGNSETSFAPLKFALTESIESAEHAAKRDGAISGVPTRFSDMDSLFGGLHNSDLIILAGRPSMGKTAFALNIMLNAAEWMQEDFRKKQQAGELEPDDKPQSTGFISLEMSSEQLATRLLAMKTGIDAGNIRRGKLEKSKRNDEFAKLVKASAELHKLPIYIDDTPMQSIAAVRTRARRLKRKHNLGLLVVDYLQLLHGVNKSSQASRVQEISEISMGLKAIAKELNIPVLALSQLSRAVEQREDKRPQLSDLRESGSIEQDADQVMFIYREGYYIERKKPSEAEPEKMMKWQEQMDKVDNISEIIMAKNRNGPIANVTLFFNKRITRFQDFSADDYGDAF